MKNQSVRVKWAKPIMALAIIMSITLTVFINVHDSKNEQSDIEDAPLPHFKAPSFTLKDLQRNRTYSVGSDMDKPLIINFWASWCPPCQSEAPDLATFYNKNKDDINIYGINMTHSDQQSHVQSFVDRYHLSFPILLDEKGLVSQSYWIKTVPTTLLISKEGIIIDRHTGYISKSELNHYLKKLGLGESYE